MSFNGSGTFLINSTGQPVVANTVISATVFNALTADLATGLTNCITKDGQSTPTANIPMGSNKITGLANGTLVNDAATLGQVQSTAAKLIGSISGVDTVLGIMSPTLTAYAAGQLFYYIAAGANTGAVTLNIDGLGAKAVTRDGSTALAAGDINSGEIVVVIYDGTRFQMINAANSFGNTTINGTLTVTGNTTLGANVSIASALAVGGKADLPNVSAALMVAAVGIITDLRASGASISSANAGTAIINSLQATGASVASMNANVALLTTATVTNLTATGASIASANIGSLSLAGVSIASANFGVAVVGALTATGASIASANVGTALVTRLDVTDASAASINANVALITTGTVTNLTSTAASIASANVGTAVITTGTVTNLTATSASVASANAGTAVVTNLTATGASIASANVGTGVVTTLTATQASVGSINAAVALVTNGTVTTLSGTQASITSANHAVLRLLGSVSGYVGLQGAAAAGSTTYTLPSADGSSGQVLSTNGSGTLSWATGGGGGTGDVVGPASATDNAITRFDLTTGKLIQNSTVILDDAGTITGVASLAATTVSVTSANAGTATITTGNLTFSSTGQRITGDMANATLTNRLAFQNSVTNANTPVNAIPNGTGTGAGFRGYGASDPTNAPSVSVFQIGTTDSRIASEINGTASYTPMTFYTGGSERMRIDSSTGNVGIGTASPDAKLTVSGGAASFADGTSSAPAIANAGDLDTGVYFPAANEVAVSAGGTVAAAFNSNGLFFRNRIINGDMRIAQRGTAAVTTNAAFPVDRFSLSFGNSTGAFSAEQSTTAPSGFVNSLKYVTTTADGSLGATEYATLAQIIEGTNVADLGWGSADARSVTLSFWCRSSVTGTFGGSIRNAANNRAYVFSFAVNSANTWEYKTIVIPGDTSGTWLTTTGAGMYINFAMGAGATLSGTAGSWSGSNLIGVTSGVNLIATLNADFYITGVQIETGSVATPFERRPYGTELMLCQRYYYRAFPNGTSKMLTVGGICFSTTNAGNFLSFPVPMRTAPSALEQSGTAGHYAVWDIAGNQVVGSAVPTYNAATTAITANVNLTVASGLTQGSTTAMTTVNAAAYLGWSAEL